MGWRCTPKRRTLSLLILPAVQQGGDKQHWKAKTPVSRSCLAQQQQKNISAPKSRGVGAVSLLSVASRGEHNHPMASLKNSSSGNNKIEADDDGNEDAESELWDKIVAMLNDPMFQAMSHRYDRIAMMEQVNKLAGEKQRMMLLPAHALASLRRIPHSSEGYAVDAVHTIEALGANLCEVFMVSHKWLRARTDPMDATTRFPDTVDNQKAKALVEFTKWRKQWVQGVHGYTPHKFYWIDYACLDQDNLSQAVPFMPLWVACCERFLRIDHPDYDTRAWCRLEPLLAHAFSFADHHTIIDEHFVNCWPYTGDGPTFRPLLNPRSGQFTDRKDLDRVSPLIDQAEFALQKKLTIQQGRIVGDAAPQLTHASIYESEDCTVKCFDLREVLE